MNLPQSDWYKVFQPLSPLQAASNQQQMQEINQLGPLQIATKQQEMNTENALAPYKIEAAGRANEQGIRENDLQNLDYQNALVGEVAQRAQAADPTDAAKIWDDGMQALADKGIPGATQYIGHYRPDLAEKVYNTYAGRNGATAKSPQDYGIDPQTLARSLATATLPELQKSLGNLNRVISSFNNVRDQDSWNAEIQALKNAGIDPASILQSTEWNSFNYQNAYNKVQGLAVYRDAIADRVALMSSGLPNVQAKPLYEPDYQSVGVTPEGKAVILDKRTGQTVLGPQMGAKPSAALGVFQTKQAAWLQVHPGDTNGALEFANGKRRMDPAQMMTAAVNAANKQLGDAALAGQTIADPDAFVRQKTAENYKLISGASNPAPAKVPARQAGPAPTRRVPDRAVAYLKSHPNLAAQFDQKYGAGASKRYLGK